MELWTEYLKEGKQLTMMRDYMHCSYKLSYKRNHGVYRVKLDLEQLGMTTFTFLDIVQVLAVIF